MGFGFSFGLFEILFTLTFVLAFGIVLTSVIRGLFEWGKNNRSPRLTVPATVVSKRSSFHSNHHNHHNGMHHTTHSTTYYVTFQVESGDRMELNLSGQDFGMLVEGDRGYLSFQGTRYLGFERQ